jgi:hypothetical protein
MSYQLGETVPFGSAARPFGDHADGNEAYERMKEHLALNDVDLSGTKFRVGRKLVIDAETESIVNDAEAGRLLTRNYREQYAVPDSV